ncbi:MAG: S1C family serine protease [Planctomycetaceae bacterium]
MKARSTPILCASMLILGIATGALCVSAGLFGPEIAQAQPAAGIAAISTESVLQRGSLQLSRVARSITPSVVHIQSTHRDGERVIEETGSGVIAASKVAGGNYVATNWHVVRGARTADIDIHLSDGRVLHPQKIWKDPETDVAILKITGGNLLPARWGDSDAVDIGHFVLAVGSPFGLSRSMTLGIISAKGRRSLRLGNKRRRVLNQNFLQTDAAINPGNSGGPLTDLQGRVIGINTAIASNSGGNDGIGFSIPSNLVRNVMDQLLAKGRVSRAYLGVKLDADFNEDTARRLGLSRVRGARIIEIYESTPASRAGLKFDDVVLRFNDVVVQDENHLINLVSLTPIGRSPKLTIIRRGKQSVVAVKLADRDELVSREERP